MNAALLFALTGIGLFFIGLYALLVHRHLLRKILAINVMGSGVFLMLSAMATRNDLAMPDPVPHAMIITGIVVAVAGTAFALILMVRLTVETGRAQLPDRQGDNP